MMPVLLPAYNGGFCNCNKFTFNSVKLNINIQITSGVANKLNNRTTGTESQGADRQTNSRKTDRQQVVQTDFLPKRDQGSIQTHGRH